MEKFKRQLKMFWKDILQLLDSKKNSWGFEI